MEVKLDAVKKTRKKIFHWELSFHTIHIFITWNFYNQWYQCHGWQTTIVVMQPIFDERPIENTESQYHNFDKGTMQAWKSCSTSSHFIFHFIWTFYPSVHGNALSTSHRPNNQQQESLQADTISSHGYQCHNSSWEQSDTSVPDLDRYHS